MFWYHEPIAIADAFELVGDDGLEGRTHAASLGVIFDQSAHEQFDVVHITVQLLQLSLDRRIAGDLAKFSHGRQAVGHPGLVEGGEADIAAALHVEREQIHSARAGARGAEEDVAHRVDHRAIDGLSDGRGEILEEGSFDIRSSRAQDVGIEERFSEFDFAVDVRPCRSPAG